MKRLYARHETVGMALVLASAGWTIAVLLVLPETFVWVLLAGVVAVVSSMVVAGWARHLVGIAAARRAALSRLDVAAGRTAAGPPSATVRVGAGLGSMVAVCLAGFAVALVWLSGADSGAAATAVGALVVGVV